MWGQGGVAPSESWNKNCRDNSKDVIGINMFLNARSGKPCRYMEQSALTPAAQILIAVSCDSTEIRDYDPRMFVA